MNIKRENALVFWLFLAPVILAFVVVIVVPFFLGAYYSFTNWTSSARADSTVRFIGLDNYIGSFMELEQEDSYTLQICKVMRIALVTFCALIACLILFAWLNNN